MGVSGSFARKIQMETFMKFLIAYLIRISDKLHCNLKNLINKGVPEALSTLR